MQCNGIANIAYHSSMDFSSLFLPQNDAHMHDFSSLDMVAPYNCNGSITMNSVSVGGGNNQAGHTNDERKKRRLSSNRESARRSRVRKQRRLDELCSQVSQLRAANQRLLVELNQVIAKHARIVHENSQLREEASDLKKKLSLMEVEEAEAAAPRTPEVA